MATAYVPNESGWSVTANSRQYYLRIKISNNYSSATNKSTFTITPEFKSVSLETTFNVSSGSLSADGTQLANFSYSGGQYRYRAQMFIGQWKGIYYAVDQTYPSWTVEKEHDYAGNCTVTFTISVACLSNSYGSPTWDNCTGEAAFSGTARTFTLTVNADGHTSVTVKDGSTEVLSGGSITGGHTLVVTAEAADGYALQTFTVNGVSETSPASVTVTGNVAVAAVSEARGLSYLLRNGSWVAHQCFIRRDGSWVQHRPFIYRNGQWIPYG